MNHRTVKKNENPDKCAKCVHCRSTMGENAKLYCPKHPIMKKKCKDFDGAFVDAFSIPVKGARK